MIRLAQPVIPEAGIQAAVDVLRSGNLVQGAECAEFERQLASFIGCGDVVVVSSGTAALQISLLALDVGPGDAVIVPDFTFPATANAVVRVGARPVMVDVQPDTYNMSVPELERALREWRGPDALKAIIPVHEFGLCAEMEGIIELARQYDLHVIEDAACALGARYRGVSAGRLGELGCFSFHPRKSLTTGDGGAISTDDPALARRLRRLRNHGIERVNGETRFLEPGANYRLTEFQAAIGRSQLDGVRAGIEHRRLIASEYGRLLRPLVHQGALRLPSSSPDHTWQTFMVVLAEHHDRGQVIGKLSADGVEATLGAQSLTALGLYTSETQGAVGSGLFQRGLALPCHQGITVSDVELVSASLKRALAMEVR